LRIAYLISRYPATNHTFILREVVALRSLGLDIRTIAIRGADRPTEKLTADERAERARTFTVLPPGWHFVKAHFATLLRHPAGYLAGLLLAIRLSGSGPRSFLYHLIYFLEAVVAAEAAQRQGATHLHTHFSSTVGVIAAKIFGLSFSISIHGPDEFRESAFRMREKVAAARFVATISHYAKSQTMQASDPADWPKVEICRLGVDPDVFQPNEPRREHLGGEEFHVVCVGRLAAVKAQRVLIDACRRLVADGRCLRLHLVGGGPDRRPLEDYARGIGMRERVVFEGPLNQDEVVALYRQCDIFALASFAEGVPVVLMEAMAMELPCVATWVNGVPELIRNEEEGLLVAPADVEGMAGAIGRLMADPELRERLGKAGRRRVLLDYDLRKNTAGLAAVFRERVF